MVLLLILFVKQNCMLLFFSLIISSCLLCEKNNYFVESSGIKLSNLKAAISEDGTTELGLVWKLEEKRRKQKSLKKKREKKRRGMIAFFIWELNSEKKKTKMMYFCGNFSPPRVSPYFLPLLGLKEKIFPQFTFFSFSSKNSQPNFFFKFSF